MYGLDSPFRRIRLRILGGLGELYRSDFGMDDESSMIG